MTEYEPVIGLEVHAQLLTRSKLFCGCSVEFGQKPNTNVCPICLGWPGSLPVLNGHAVGLAIRAALALNCNIQARSVFARKQYFYPDLPKGYQISQYEQPLSERGYLEIELEGQRKRAGITRVHMEEDAGKNVHGVGKSSVVDLNRAGTPLIEIVGDPDLYSSEEAAAYMRALREVLVFIGVNDGNLEEGSFRCDANVSLRPVGSTELGTRTELKNLNSFRFVQRAIDAEIARQTEVLEGGGKVVQETRSFDPERNITRPLRSKADAHDYRYFPDPDLPPLHVPKDRVETEKRALPPLPDATRRHYTETLGLAEKVSRTLTSHPRVTELFEAVVKLHPHPKQVANWITTEVMREVTTAGLSADIPVTAEQVAGLLRLVSQGDISGKQAKEVHVQLVKTDLSAEQVVEMRGMKLVSDTAALGPMCQAALASNPSAVEQYRAGKQGTLGYFVGHVMKQSKGSANPKLVSEMLKKLLDGAS
jgi:aspartyl-tRNA(Asn)/glutamyl-tRNA(Gln) amidotransferase subunit B